MIMLTGAGDRRVDIAALAAGAADYLIKDHLSPDLVERSIRYAIQRKRIEQLLHDARDRLETQVETRTRELTRANRDLKQEIDVRKMAEKELLDRESLLRASEERYRIISLKSSDGIAIVQEGKTVFVNPAMAGMIKTPVAALVGSRTMDWFQGSYREGFETGLELMGGERPQASFEGPVLPSEGQVVWTEWKFSFVDWKGKRAWLCMVRDITRTKARETAVETEAEQLRKSYNQLRAKLKGQYRFGDIVGKSPAMQAICDFILNASQSEAHVAIEGESGTGKELVARARELMVEMTT